MSKQAVSQAGKFSFLVSSLKLRALPGYVAGPRTQSIPSNPCFSATRPCGPHYFAAAGINRLPNVPDFTSGFLPVSAVAFESTELLFINASISLPIC